MLTLEDRLELHELVGRYGDAIDDRAWDRLDAIFTEDAVFEVRGLGITMRGLQGIKTFMDEAGDKHPQAHLMVNVYCLETGNGVELRSRGIFPEPNPSVTDHSSLLYHGSYYDRVVRTEHGWRIAHRVYSRQRLSGSELP